MPDIPLGRFCWYELLTTDPDAAPGFYGRVAGWSTAPFQGEEAPTYTMWMNGETPIGGIMEKPAEPAEAPSHWLVHISTPDLDRTTSMARELGGEAMHRMEVPTVGEFAIIRDPQGAIFSAYQPAGDAPGHDGPPALGEFSWHELATDDWEEAWAFYSALFGWQRSDAMDLGDMGIYQTFGRGTHALGGLFNRPPGTPGPFWLFYIRVRDVDEAVREVEAAGGKLLDGPMQVPGGDRVARCMDPQGAAFALHSTAQA